MATFITVWSRGGEANLIAQIVMDCLGFLGATVGTVIEAVFVLSASSQPRVYLEIIYTNLGATYLQTIFFVLMAYVLITMA